MVRRIFSFVGDQVVFWGDRKHFDGTFNMIFGIPFADITSASICKRFAIPCRIIL